MRNSSPAAPAAYQANSTLPPAGYDDPKPTNDNAYNSQFTQLVARGNAAGVAGSQPLQAADPTAGAASVGGWSYNLDSGNYNFTLPVVSLAGRAGLNLNLALSYNSKVWTKDAANNAMVFNAERGWPAPGWQVGFGHIQTKDAGGNAYLNGTTGKASLIFVAPDGTRRDLAYNAATGRFESYDASYLAFDAAAQTMYFPDGSKAKYGAYSYNATNRDFRALPVQIKDRHGNFITISYKTLDSQKVVIDYVIDTAGRRVDFNYQNNRLTWIGQNRNGVTYKYVNIDYQPVTIQTNFVAPLVTDPSNINGTQVYLPSRVTYPTGLNYRFTYTSYGQLNNIEKWAPGVTGQGVTHKVAATSFNLPTYQAGVFQGDCPRFTLRTEWAENWRGGDPQFYQYLYNGPNGHEVTDPTARTFRVRINGLVHYVGVMKDSTQVSKATETTYTADAGAHLPNLRPTQTLSTFNGGNGTQLKKITYAYTQLNGMWLPTTKDEYAQDVIYRRTVTAYTSYPAQYLLGLPLTVSVYAGAGTTLLARTTNNYDETGTFTDSNNQTASYFIDATSAGVIQHDDKSYDASFTQRGNVTSVTQSSVVNGAVNGSRITKHAGYDTNGNVRHVSDGAGNRQQFYFDDYCLNKPASVGQTHVIPRTAADPTDFRSGSQWNYFTGQTIKTFNLLPGSGTELQIVTTSYDFADRPVQTTKPDGGWVKTAYWDNWLATVTAQLLETGKTRYQFAEYDGAGRTRRKANDHPDGIAGKYAGQISVFDKVGEVEDSSNVVAIDGYWNPIDEDEKTGFLFTHLTRDELSRLKVITFPDNNTRAYDYTGCGCAGASETRMTDELGHYTTTKTDALGRLLEAVEPGGGANNIYSKAEYVYDALDRLREIKHSDTTLTKIQNRYFNYDGYGRLTSETTPEGGTMAYSYYANDLLEQKTDARGVWTYHAYNTRGLLTGMAYGDGTPSVAIGYDQWGARSWMADGEGAAGYYYNSYRQLWAEQRTFTGLPGRMHTLTYAYNLGEQLKQVNYAATATGGTAQRGPGGGGFGPESANYSVQGQVKHAVTGLGMAGVTVNAQRLDDVETRTVQTGTGGGYIVEDLPELSTWRFTAAQTGFNFTPTERTYEMTENKTDANFSGLESTASGTLSANPNPLQVCDGSGLGQTTLSWSTVGVLNIEIHSGAPNGPLIGGGSASGSIATGKTVAHNTVFYLQNVTGGKPLTSANTLSTVTVTHTTQGCPGIGNYNKTINYVYNSVGALTSVGTDMIGSDPNATTNVLNTAQFRANGALRSLLYGNNRQLTMSYNVERGQPIAMKVDRVGNPADQAVNYSYEYYDAQGHNNNRLRKVIDNLDPAYTTDYTYDAWDRLTYATATGYARSYQYDAWGNITNFNGATFSYATNASGAPATNRIASVNFGGGPVTHTYDAAGNLTGDGVSSYAYDGASRLKGVNSGTSTYGYDGNGQRVRVTDNGTTVFYVHSTVLGQTAMEVRSTATHRAYVYARKKLIAEQATDGQFYWRHTNQLNTVRTLTDASGNMVYRGQFDPYGQALTEWSATSNLNLNGKKFTGYERDAATGLDYAQARMYSSGRGRFMQPEPQGIKNADLKRLASLNRYSYVENDPINFVDPSGLFIAVAGCEETVLDGIFIGNSCDPFAGIFGGPLPLFYPPGVDQGPAPGPAPVTSTCTVTLGSRGLNYPGLQSIVHHMFITTQTWSTDQSKNQLIPTVFQGTHEGKYLRVRENSFQAGNEDYNQSRNPGAVFAEVTFAGTCDEANASFRATMGKINDANIEYQLPKIGINGEYFSGTKNSNAAAYTLLQRWSPMWREVLEGRYREQSGRPFSLFTPGWGTQLVN